MEYIQSIHRGHLQWGRRQEKCIPDGVLDGASMECQSIHGAYKVRVVHTKPRPNLHPNPHLLTLIYCWIAAATILDAADLFAIIWAFLEAI